MLCASPSMWAFFVSPRAKHPDVFNSLTTLLFLLFSFHPITAEDSQKRISCAQYVTSSRKSVSNSYNAVTNHAHNGSEATKKTSFAGHICPARSAQRAVGGL
jgi:hypothetical protein